MTISRHTLSPRSATVVVHPVPGEGDATSLAEALTLLPAEGGVIFMREGVHTISSGITLPVGKGVVIVGAGDAFNGKTEIHFTAVNGALFDAPVSIGIPSNITLKNLVLTGDGATDQKLFRSPAINAFFDEIMVDCCEINGFRQIVRIEPLGQIGEAIFSHTSIDLQANPSASFWNNQSGGQYSLVWEYVEATVPVGSSVAVFGATSGPSWTVINSYVGGPPVSTYMVSRANWIGFSIDSADITIVGGDSQIDSCLFSTGVGIKITAQRCTISNSIFSIGGPGSFMLKLSNQDQVISGCIFDGGGGTGLGIDIEAPATNVVISGCRFEDFPIPFTVPIRVASSDVVVTGCEGGRVSEIGSANGNRYANNSGFDGSSIIGTSSLVNDQNIRTVTASLTLNETHRTVLGNATSGPFTVNLPPAASARHRIYTIKKIDASANAITIDGDGAETIDGAATVVLLSQWDRIKIQSDGVSWFRID